MRWWGPARQWWRPRPQLLRGAGQPEELEVVELVVPHEVSVQARRVVELSRAVGNEEAPGFETETQALQVALLHGLVNMTDRYREALHATAADA